MEVDFDSKETEIGIEDLIGFLELETIDVFDADELEQIRPLNIKKEGISEIIKPGYSCNERINKYLEKSHQFEQERETLKKIFCYFSIGRWAHIDENYDDSKAFHLMAIKEIDELEVIEDEENSLRKMARLKTLVYLDLLDILIKEDHDFLEANALLEKIEALELEFKIMDNNMLSAFRVCQLTVLKELNLKEKYDAVKKNLKEDLKNGKTKIEKEKRMNVVLGYLEGENMTPSEFDLFIDLCNENENKQKMRLRLAKIKAFSPEERKSKEYKELKEQFLNNCHSFKESNEWHAEILKVEYEDNKDIKLLEKAIDLYKEDNLDFHVAETEIFLFLEKLKSQKKCKRKELNDFFHYWKMLEKKTGISIIDMLLSKIKESKKPVEENVKNTSEKIKSSCNQNQKQEEENLLLADFERIPGLPNYANDIMEIIIYWYGKKNKTLSDALQKALRDHSHINFLEIKNHFQRLKDEFKNLETKQIETSLKEFFGVDFVRLIKADALNKEDLNICEKLSKKALDTERPMQDRHICFPEEGMSQKQMIAIPDAKKENVFLLKKSKGSFLTQKEIELLEAIMNQNLEEAFKENISEFLIPKNNKLIVLRNEPIPKKYEKKITELYIKTLGFPSIPHGDLIILIVSEEDELLSSAVLDLGLSVNSAPFIIKGFPKDKSVCEEFLEESLDKYVEIGTFATDKFFEKVAFPLLAYYTAQEVAKLGYEKGITVCHNGIKRFYDEYVNMKDVELEKSINSISEEEQDKRAMESLNLNPESWKKLKETYVKKHRHKGRKTSFLLEIDMKNTQDTLSKNPEIIKMRKKYMNEA